MNIVLFGPPGSGKGTQGDKLAKKFNLFKISSGDLLREEVRKNTNLGKKIKLIIEIKSTYYKIKFITINKILSDKLLKFFFIQFDILFELGDHRTPKRFYFLVFFRSFFN